MKRVLATVFAMAFVGAWAAVADECGVGVDVNEIDSSNWTVTLAYKVSMKGQSLQRTADIDCGTECGCVFDLGKMQKINDKTYLIMNVDLPVSSVDWFCSTVAIGPNAAGVDLNNVWVWFGDELVDFAAETYSLDSWKLKGFVDEKTVDKKEKQVKSLFALTWFTSYSDSCDGSETEFKNEYNNQFPPAPHLTVPTRDMQTGTLSMQLLSANNKMIALDKLTGDKHCSDMLIPVPQQFDGCLHGFVDWYNPVVNCWEHLNLDVSARLDKKLTKCLNTCSYTPDGCDYDTRGFSF